MLDLKFNPAFYGSFLSPISRIMEGIVMFLDKVSVARRLFICSRDRRLITDFEAELSYFNFFLAIQRRGKIYNKSSEVAYFNANLASAIFTHSDDTKVGFRSISFMYLAFSANIWEALLRTSANSFMLAFGSPR